VAALLVGSVLALVFDILP